MKTLFHRVIFLLLLVPVTVVMSALTLLGRTYRAGGLQDRISTRYGMILRRLIGARMEADLSALAPGRPYVFFVNHQSFMDIPVLFDLLSDYNPKFVAKESLFRFPVFGPALKRSGHIVMTRENSRQAMRDLQVAIDRVRQWGVSPIIFPEGTRSSDPAALQEFKPGGAILALKTGLPVAPLVMAGTWEMLPRDGLLPRPGLALVKALPPIEPGRYTLKEREKFTAEVRTAMDAAYRDLRAELSKRIKEGTA